jgi:membrane protease YdiL (CAAX protease family)
VSSGDSDVAPHFITPQRRVSEPYPDSDNAWKPWYGPVAAVTAFLVGAIAGVIVVVIGSAAGASIKNAPPGVVDVATIVEEVSFVFTALLIAAQVARPRLAQFGLRPPRVRLSQAAILVPIGYVGFLIFAAIWSALLNSSSSEKHLVKEVGGHSGILGILGAVLVTCVVAPICEEFLFRGFIFGALRNWRGPWLAAILTGVLFGAIHVGSAPAVDLVPLGALGVILCAIRQWTGSLYPTIALHAFNNSIALGVNLGWGWQIPVVIVGSLAAIFLVITLIVRVVGPRARLA